MEVWKDIKNYEGIYTVSNCGDIKSILKNRILKKRICKQGYSTVALFKDGKRTEYKQHRLVADAFLVSNKLNDVVNHKNGVRDDNRIENLEYVTSRENVHHYLKNKNKIIGVYFDKRFNRWISRIYINKKNKNIGTYKCPTAAMFEYLKELKINSINSKYV